jgi:hypothetical protein
MKKTPVNFWDRLKEISRFFQGRDEVHKTMRRLVKRLERANIRYAIIGGMAVHMHGHHQATGNVNVLLTADGFNDFRARFVPEKYDSAPERPGWFVDLKNEVRLSFRVTGRFPSSGKPGPIAFPHPDQVSETINEVQVVNFATLIQLKLAARRFGDLADVISLIRVHNLDESFAERLHPSLHHRYSECLEARRREDEWNATHGW